MRIKKQRTFNFKAFIIQLLRRGTYKYPPRNEALKAARISRGIYKCEMCQGIFPKKEITLDHKNPVVEPKIGFVDWNTYIPRMFPEVQGFQTICRTCHDSKTKIENILRKKYRQKKKKTV